MTYFSILFQWVGQYRLPAVACMVAGFELSLSWGVPRKEPGILDDYSVVGTLLGT